MREASWICKVSNNGVSSKCSGGRACRAESGASVLTIYKSVGSIDAHLRLPITVVRDPVFGDRQVILNWVRPKTATWLTPSDSPVPLSKRHLYPCPRSGRNVRNLELTHVKEMKVASLYSPCNQDQDCARHIVADAVWTLTLLAVSVDALDWRPGGRDRRFLTGRYFAQQS